MMEYKYTSVNDRMRNWKPSSVVEIPKRVYRFKPSDAPSTGVGFIFMLVFSGAVAVGILGVLGG